MPIAAVPQYLGQDFSAASPGLRFGMYLPVWTNRQDQEKEVNKRAQAKSHEGKEVADLLPRQGMDAAIQILCKKERNPLPGLWDKNKFAADAAWRQIATLTTEDQKQNQALVHRQQHVAFSLGNERVLTIMAQTIAPFTTGLGNEHPLENGFAFLNPYGLPYLPGSGVKGVLRQAARELVSGEWGETRGWTNDVVTALFGRQGQDGDTDHLRGALTFWDVIPQIKGDHLHVEIMTPHQTHYYQEDAKKGAGSVTPHDSGSPTPISFLTVPPDSGFTFHVQCDLALLKCTASKLAENEQWKKLLETAFTHAFEWLGFGAKTAVGYGAMKEDAQAAARAQAQEAERLAAEERAKTLAQMTPQGQQIETLRRAYEDHAKQFSKHSTNSDLYQRATRLVKTALQGTDWNADDKTKLADMLEEWLPKVIAPWDAKEQRKKLQLAQLRGAA